MISAQQKNQKQPMMAQRRRSHLCLLLMILLVFSEGRRCVAQTNPFKPTTESPFRKKADSPFTPVPSDSNDSSADQQDGAPQSNRPSRSAKKFRHGKYVPVKSPEGGWSYTPGQLTPLEYEPERVDVAEIDFPERIKQFCVNRPGTLGAITAQRPQGNTQIKVMDFLEGEVVASIVTPKELLVLDVDDSGQRLVLVSDKYGFGEKREIGTFLVNDSVLVEESMFIPFPDLRVPDLDVVSADFVGDHHLLIVSFSGRVSLWDLEKLREECGFDLNSRGSKIQVVSGPDPDVVAFADKEQFGLFDIRRQEFLGVSPIPEGMTSPQIAVSPSGTRLVLAESEKAIVIDAINGQIQEEIPLPAGPLTRVEFANDDFLLVSSQSLISISDRMLLWTYIGAENSVSVHGTTFFMMGGSSAKGTVIPKTLPDPQAVDALETAHSQPDLFVVRPGDSVQIDVSKVPSQFRPQVQAALEQALHDRELSVADKSDVVMTASITGPEQKVVEYSQFGRGGGASGYVVSEFVSTLEILWKGQVAWRKERTNAPGSITPKKGQSIQDILREKTSQPNLRLFAQAGFPRYVRKPEGKSAESKESLGQSNIEGLF
ncbi:MAG: WD40 repeat domain-containing protein [Planctomycetaceae bacterium]|nr:WD40 repeat domain-containing protein [Planctomycetaceae bacterium]